MEYIAHLNEGRIQTLKDHLYGTAELAECFAGRFGKSDWAMRAAYSMILESTPLLFRIKLRITATDGWIIRLPVQKRVLKRAGCTTAL